MVGFNRDKETILDLATNIQAHVLATGIVVNVIVSDAMSAEWSALEYICSPSLETRDTGHLQLSIQSWFEASLALYGT